MFEIMLVTKLVPVRVEAGHSLVANACATVIYSDRVSAGGAWCRT